MVWAALISVGPVAAQDASLARAAFAGTSPAPATGSSDRAPRSTDGKLELSWQPAVTGKSWESATTFQLEETFETQPPVTLEAGPHRATTLSGRDDGVYQYRVRPVASDGGPGPWSEPILLRVEHHSLTLALSIFAVGAVVFLATAGLVVCGHRRSRPVEPAI